MTGDKTCTGSLDYVMDLPSRRDEVWALWTSPRRLTRWLGAGVEVEPVVGGRFVVARDGTPVAGEVIFVDRPRLLVLDWSLEGNRSRVEVRLLPTLDGTRLEVSHRGLSEALRPSTDRRWQAALERLRGCVRRDDC